MRLSTAFHILPIRARIHHLRTVHFMHSKIALPSSFKERHTVARHRLIRQMSNLSHNKIHDVQNHLTDPGSIRQSNSKSFSCAVDDA